MNLLIFNLKTDVDDSVLGFTTGWINALAAQCDHVTVITMMAGRISVANNVTVYSVGKEKGYTEFRRLLEFYQLLWKVLHKQKIDVCFAHMMPLFAVLGWPLLRSRKIPIMLWYTHSHISILLRLATCLVDRVVSASPSGFQIGTHKVRFIGHGIDVDKFVPLKNKNNQLLALLNVGRISPIKHLEVIIDAIALLPTEIKHKIEMRFVGNPIGAQGTEYAMQLMQRVSGHGLDSVIKFLPALPFHQVVEAYQGADIFIHSSHSGGLDKTGLEAMSCGLPVVTNNIAFLNVLKDSLMSEWLVENDNPEELSKVILRLLKMPSAERQKIGSELRNIIKKEHSLNKLVCILISEMQKLILNKKDCCDNL